MGEAAGEVEADRYGSKARSASLVENAFGTAPRPIRLDAAQEGNRVLFRVTDSGADFRRSSSTVPSSASPVPTRRARRRAQASLSIAAAVARAHGGEATARNLPGGGAEVTLSLPVAFEP